ncbi:MULTISPECIES: hypothetical protein [unclassified Citrobacter]|nr:MULTISPECIES: hypothetical protein [unclassified Citrobacter]
MIDPTLIALLIALAPFASPVIDLLMEWARLELKERYTRKKLK